MSINTTLIISFFIIVVLGTLLHFTHAWFKKGIFLHFFSDLNESTWEHMKMLVAPTIVVSIFQYFLIEDTYINLNNSILFLLVIELFTIPALFEPLRIILKKVPFPVTIGIFFAAIILGITAQYFVLIKKILIFPENVALIIYIFIIICFAVFSYLPPRIFIFRDPITGHYGDLHEDLKKNKTTVFTKKS